MLVMKIQVLLYAIFVFLLIELVVAQDGPDMPHGDDFELDCETCHTTEGWNIDQRFIIFNHDQTGFALLGEHTKAECRSCHKSLIFNRIGHACADCHTDIHKNELGIRCENCHTPVSWENRRDIFELHENSTFPLLGVHALLDCESCHQNQQTDQFKLTPVECRGCHIPTFMATLNPAHQKAGLSLNCETCHLPNVADWKRAVNYSHSQGFPLEAGHSGLECIDCHAQVYSGTPSNCVACHLEDYNSALEPNHLTFGFPTNCERCHNAAQWTGTTFNHLEVSGFALNGAHGTIQCNQCHANNQLTGLPRVCFGCHESDFNAVSDPNHRQNGFSHDCLDCHNENAWTPADFDHNQTNFPLTGAHISVNCIDCHQSGQWSGVAVECFACHESDYNNTTNPGHLAAQFPTDCASCHTATAWEPANWDHDGQYFPIYSGKHRDEWNVCADCHINTSDYNNFECIYCHEHSNKQKVDNDHKEVNDYSYDSPSCYRCHPDGNAED